LALTGYSVVRANEITFTVSKIERVVGLSQCQDNSSNCNACSGVFEVRESAAHSI